MIPADLTARLRLLTEATFFSKEPREVGALKNVQPVPEDLPEFMPGDRIVATLREATSASTFKALIDGREYTLSLPRNTARSGQTLDLVVNQATPRAVVATVADPSTTTVAANLSQTGRMISFLLTGQPTPPPANLAGGQALLQAPPSSAAPLVPVLRQAISESGLFYESHLARWLAGAISTDSLLKQPQSLLTRGRPGAAPPAGALGAAPGGTAPPPATTLAAPLAASPGTSNTAQAASAASAMGQDAEQVGAANESAGTRRNFDQTPQNSVPERLMPIVHQQLDALATNTYAWQGTIWPGQTLQLEIEDPDERDSDGSEDGNDSWNTTLRLTLPKLGGIEARMSLTGAGIDLRFRTADESTAASLDAARDELAEALASADIPLIGMRVDLVNGADGKS